MNQNLKSKIIKENKIGGRPVYNAKKLTKVYDKDSKKYTFKSTDVVIKKTVDSLQIYLFKKTKEILICHLCLKHVSVSRATDITVPRIDSCRVFSDPVSKQTLLSFSNPSIANDYEMKISKEQEYYNSVYANINYFVNVTNKINETMKESASVCVSGLTTGAEFKLWIEKEFNFSEIHMPKYLLQLQVDNNIQTIKDDIPLLVLYEHMSCNGTQNVCSKDCFDSSRAPQTPLSLHINLNIIQSNHKDICKVDSYSIEDKWGAGMMPNWLIRLLSDLYYHGPQYEGVFRLCGRDHSLSKWYKHMLEFDDFVINEDIYNKAAILKYFIRKIKGSLMTQNNKREFDNLCKKFMKITAEKYLENEKKREILLRLIQILPKTHLFLLQNLLVVIQALTNSEKTLFKPFSIARAIYPSIFPLMNLSRWKYGTKLFEAIILLTDKLVTDSVKQHIIESYSKFQQNSEVSKDSNDMQVHMISGKSSSTSILSIDETDPDNFPVQSEELESEFELDSSEVQHSDYMTSSNENFSSSDNENDFGSYYEILNTSEDELAKQDLSSKSSSMSKEEICENLVIYETDDLKQNVLTTDKAKDYKNLESYHSCVRSIELDLSMDNSKENNQSIVNNEDTTIGLRHRSLLKAENSSIKELNRSSSTIVTSPRIPRLRNRDIKSPEIEVLRKNSRKALSAVVEVNNNFDTIHRSRSPNVKTLIKMYEEKNKLIVPGDLMENNQRNLRSKRNVDGTN